MNSLVNKVEDEVFSIFKGQISLIASSQKIDKRKIMLSLILEYSMSKKKNSGKFPKILLIDNFIFDEQTFFKNILSKFRQNLKLNDKEYNELIDSVYFQKIVFNEQKPIDFIEKDLKNLIIENEYNIIFVSCWMECIGLCKSNYNLRKEIGNKIQKYSLEIMDLVQKNETTVFFLGNYKKTKIINGFVYEISDKDIYPFAVHNVILLKNYKSLNEYKNRKLYEMTLFKSSLYFFNRHVFEEQNCAYIRINLTKLINS